MLGTALAITIWPVVLMKAGQLTVTEAEENTKSMLAVMFPEIWIELPPVKEKLSKSNADLCKNRMFGEVAVMEGELMIAELSM